MKTALFITYHFYPSSEVGAKRIARICKYLTRYNIDPIILTIQENFYSNLDFSLPILKNIKTFRTKTIHTDTNGLHNPGRKQTSLWARKIFSKIIVPDKYIFWMPFAIQTAKYIFAKYPVDLIIASGPWFSTFIIALAIKLMSKKPLILDFRDQWSLNVAYRNKKRYILHKILEKVTIASADGIIFTTPHLLKQYKLAYGNLPRTKIIENCFDPDDFLPSIHNESHKFTVTYAGNFYWPRSPDNFFKALEICKKTNKLSPTNFQFINIGNLDNKIINKFPYIGDLIENKGILPHLETLNYIKKSDILLLIVAPGHEANIPAKLYEYLASNRPILLLSPIGSNANMIVKRAKSGIIANIDNISDIVLKLGTLIENSHKSFHPNSDIVNKYNCICIAQKMAEFIKNI